MQIPMRQEYIRKRLQVLRPEQRVICMDPELLALHEDAAKVLEGAAEQVASEAGVPVSIIHDRLFQFVFRLEPSGSLLLVLSVPERDVEINVELPHALWKQTTPEKRA
ncbi:hypothetical protein LN040_05090 [Desulfovibrio subterraneus]|jgi:hypothetical protein|uniref:Uncharacterized protein n=1 Tax=Desulfovibrio subterraneus TaxID=2718620 RepID=A0A7J0BMI5_9BACT|nr:hypothetical protein [Desulfovibrio subterraneus]WBF68482.1 hypothetical protein LN040_05090 [Desulfovibrio subterraneus]GFM34441.1 hypothetical protein DSM101010T_28060 [Desulfovibrio subterraneus]